MATATILLIGRISKADDDHLKVLSKRYTVRVAASGKQALAMAAAETPDVFVLHAVSMRTTGDRICQQVRQHHPHIPVLHIHPQPDAATRRYDNVLVTAASTPRKLVNSLNNLLQSHPDDLLECGPFAMNVRRRILVAGGRETQLTPKVALLTELFLRNPNCIIDRKTLMETIWETDYLGDTRTLDVHIRWLRQALECDGAEPRRLKTVRGIGYRLDVPMVSDAGRQALPQL